MFKICLVCQSRQTVKKTLNTSMLFLQEVCCLDVNLQTIKLHDTYRHPTRRIPNDVGVIRDVSLAYSGSRLGT